MVHYCRICGCGILPGYLLCDVCGGHAGSRQVFTVKTCSSCLFWTPSMRSCAIGREGMKHYGQDFCKEWKENPKYTIMREKMDEQINISRWNTLPHRRLEVL